MADSKTSQSNNTVVTLSSALEPIIPDFFQDTQNDLRAMQVALIDNDFETVRRLGHSLKGAGKSYGFDRLSDIGRSIEREAESQDSTSTLKWVSELSQYLEHVQIVFD